MANSSCHTVAPLAPVDLPGNNLDRSEHQLARLFAARASGRGTGQQILSTFDPYKPSSYQASSASPPTLAMSPILQQQLPFKSFLLPKQIPPIQLRNRQNLLPYDALLSI